MEAMAPEIISYNNKIIERSGMSAEDSYAHTYNFINIPWDDRSNQSKTGIIVLLLSIFTATIACVIGSFVMHYRVFPTEKVFDTTEITCHLVKADEYPFVARIHSVSTHELLCVGAVISMTSILANDVCIKSGPIRLRLGNLREPRCKKGFSVDFVDIIYHDGVASKKLVVLYSKEHFSGCARYIRIGSQLSWGSPAYIVGRPLYGIRSLSRQPAILIGKGNCTGTIFKRTNKKSTICVKDLARCPVRAGDLLVQKGRLFGLASTSMHPRDHNNLAYFADLDLIRRDIRGLDIMNIS